MTRSRACAVLAFVLTLTAVVYALPTIQVTPLPRDGRLLVSFRLTDAFSDEVKTAIHSGLTITFVYDIELRRSSAMWVERKSPGGSCMIRKVIALIASRVGIITSRRWMT